MILTTTTPYVADLNEYYTLIANEDRERG